MTRIRAERQGDPGDIIRRFGEGLRWYVKTVATELWGSIIEESPVRTSFLANSWRLRTISPLEYGVGSDAAYAAAVNEGTRPHDIVARGRALRFEWNGRTVFFRRVRHPGTTANPYVDRAIERVEQRLNDFAAQAVDRMGA